MKSVKISTLFSRIDSPERRSKSNLIRKRGVLEQTKRKPSRGVLWSDAYAPKSGGELETCVNKDTVRCVRQWMLAATSARDGEVSTASPKRLLILCGKPGIGKSTTARVLALELGLDLSEWSDTYGQISYIDPDSQVLLPNPDQRFEDRDS